jgi:hypothetical protein
MYIVSRSNDEKYGNVVAILRTEDGQQSPFFISEEAKKEKRLWEEQEKIKVRFMVDNQILTINQLETWAHEEYRHLPKCSYCAHILYGDVHTNGLSSGALFCSTFCADRDYHIQVERLDDCEECDF